MADGAAARGARDRVMSRPEPSSFAQAIRTLAPVMRDRWWTIPVLVVLGILAALTEGIGIGLLIPLFATMFGSGAGSETAGAFLGGLGAGMSEEERVRVLVAIVLVLVVARALIQFSYDAVSVWFGGLLVHRLHRSLFRRLLDVGYAYFGDKETGALFEIVRGRTWIVSEAVAHASRALISLCTIAVFTLLLMLISPMLTLFAAIGAGVVALVIHRVTKRVRPIGDEAVAVGNALSGVVIAALRNMRVIRLFGQEDRAFARLDAVSEKDRVAARRLGVIGAAIQPATELAYVPIFLGILIGAWASGLDLATLIGFLVLLYRLQPHVRRLDQIRVEIAGMMPMVDQVVDLLRREGKPFVPSGDAPFERLEREIRFERVGFAYESGHAERGRAVEEIDLVIPADRTTALVGESGSGKSTLLNLLFRLYDPTSGRILVDGRPLQRLDLAAWRGRLAFAGQDAEIVGETIRDAISFGHPQADARAVEKAARRAHAEEFIRRLPQGYDTPIGEGGLQLSAGQRQRLGLARALVREPSVLVLDEATSALDAISEHHIQAALAELAGAITMVVVAHRLSTIRNADHVVVLQGGRVVEEGSPQDLLARPGSVLARMWRLQTDAFAPSRG